MPRLLLITNPVAARTSPRVLRTVTTVLTREGWNVEVAETTRPGHAGELARAAVEDGVTRIAVYGGDGTTMQAVRGVVGREVEFGLIPGGTGNLLAGNLRLPRAPARAARIVARGSPRSIDLGRMMRGDGEHYFAVACGAGYDAELMAKTTSEAKRRWKFAAYVRRAVQTINDLQNVPYRITVDGTVLEGDAATVLVANCGEFVPPFFRFRRGILVDDGLFDVVMVRANNLLESIGVVGRMLFGSPHSSGNLRFARGTHVTVDCDPSRPVQLDGEPAGNTPFTAELLPRALHVVVPRPD